MKRIHKRMMCFGLVITLICGLSACTPNQATAPEGTTPIAKDEPVKVAAILMDSSSEVTTTRGEAMQVYADSVGVDFSIQYHNRDVAKLQSMIENAITAQVDILIIEPETPGECVDAITQATESGIITIIHNMAMEAAYTYRFSAPHYQMGYDIGVAAAAWAEENLIAKGEPAIIAVGSQTISPIAMERHYGIVDALSERLPDSEIVYTFEGAYKEDGLVAGESIQQAHPEVNLVVAINDNCATGVYEAFIAAGRGDDTIGIFGLDGTNEALHYISQGGIYKATRRTDHDGLAAMQIQAGIDALNQSDSAPEDQVILWETTLIDGSNIAEYEYLWGSLAQ